jgi:site-specific DNA recombinase
MGTKSEKLRRLYENKLVKLEENKARLENDVVAQNNKTPNFETALDGVFNFVKNPRVFYDARNLRAKRTVLNLVFAKNLEYDKEKGFGTASKSLLFRLVEPNSDTRLQLASPRGFEPLLLP